MRRWAAGPEFADGLHRALTGGAAADDGPAEHQIADWLSQLRLFHGVPFHLLVPDPRMLPPESIRFFAVDENWIAALLDGAFSIGRSATRDASSEVPALRELLPRAAAGTHGVRRARLGRERGAAEASPAEMSGFVLRSSIAVGWPGLEVSGYSTTDHSGPLELLRLDRVADDILLCLFAGRVRMVTFSEPADTLQFGFVLPAAPTDPYVKRLKYVDAPGHEPGTLIPGAEVTAEARPGGKRVLDIEHLQAAVLAKLREVGGITPGNPYTPAEFALEMVQGVEQVDYREGPS
jgi:hypothetical protein